MEYGEANQLDGEFNRSLPYVWWSKEQEGNTELKYKTPENSPKMVASTSSKKRRRKKLSLDSDSDSDNENTADGFTTPSKLGKRRVPPSKEKVRRNRSLQELKEKRTAGARKSKGSELEEADQLDLFNTEEPGISFTTDSESLGESLSAYDANFIDDDAVNSQEMQQLEKEMLLIQKPSLHQAYMCYLTVALSNLLNDNSTSEIESNLWYEKCKSLLEDTLSSKKRLVESTVWGEDFKRMIQTPYALKEEQLSHSVDTCQACKRKRNVTRCFVFCDEDNNGATVQTFEIGIYCAERGALFHDLHNHLSVELQKKCQNKVNKVTMEIDSADDVVEYCMSDEAWTENLFKRFEYLLNESDKWAEDGVKMRKMIAACSEYN